jgi:hypothetical protein
MRAYFRMFTAKFLGFLPQRVVNYRHLMQSKAMFFNQD